MSGDRTSAHSTGGNFNYALCTRAGFAGRSARQAARATVTIMGALLALATFPDVATAQRAADSFAGVQAVPAGIRTLSEVHPHYFSRMGDPGAPSVPAIAGQVALGTLATPVGYVGGGLATRWIATRLGVSDDAARRAAYVGAYAGSTLATAATVEYLGRTGRVAGSFPATIGGTVAGELAAWGVVELGRSLYSDSPECNLICRALGISAFVLPSVGATVGHAVTREWR